jgi:hydroxymethylbilane synthase
VQAAIEGLDSDLECGLVTIKTSGDRFADRSLRAIGGKGLFVKEIEDALLAGDVDCAVHSMKDLPAELAPGLVIAAVPAREDARDLLIARGGSRLKDLASGARVGTSSLRRAAFVRCSRSDLDLVELRGNVDSRLRKLDGGEVDAIILAAAGLKRLGIPRADAHPFDEGEFVPAIGQGALAIECRAGDEKLLAALDHYGSRQATVAERAFLARVGGSCHTPIGAHAKVTGGAIAMHAAIASPDGRTVVRGATAGSAADAASIGAALADKLLDDGGAEILRALETSPEPHAAP